MLDNGHGQSTAGKKFQFPDGLEIKEYEFNRDVVKRISNKLNKAGIENVILVPELDDISLAERCRRANAIYKDRKDAILISIHANAGGGTGWEAHTSVGKTKADDYATIIYETAKEYFPEWRIRGDWSDGDPDWESNFYILKHTSCPAILTENFFMDTRRDCEFIVSDEGRELIADMHVAAIKKF